mgnify:FL=1
MKTISKNSVITLEIKKSKFIGYTFSFSNIEDVEKELKILKNEHSSATHICYAYILDSLEKCSDDGEPSGTAGLPILEVIKKNNLNNILVVVVRYFGGIKLGAGGLIRAYSKCASCVLKESSIKELVLYNMYKLELSYANMPLLNKIIKNNEITILNTTYANNVICEIATNLDISIFSNICLSVEKMGKEWF